MDFKKIFLVLYCLTQLHCHLFAIRAGYFEPWGKDASLTTTATSSKPSIYDVPASKNPFIQGMDLLVRFHQNIISPVDGPRSHFRPTSSRYMLLAMKRHGFFKGYIMGCDRLLRENSDPWVYRKKEIEGVVYKWDPTYRSH